MYARVETTERKFTSVNSIEYDMKLCQIMKNILNCTDVQLKGLKIITTYRRNVDIAYTYVVQLYYFKEDAISEM